MVVHPHRTPAMLTLTLTDLVGALQLQIALKEELHPHLHLCKRSDLVRPDVAAANYTLDAFYRAAIFAF